MHLHKIKELSTKARQARPTSSGHLTKVNMLKLKELQKARHFVPEKGIPLFFTQRN